jgi:hypothetical protein
MNAATPKKREWPAIRVFVISTFTDFKHERDALHQNVFRKLELHCATRGLQFQAIDLRWGVPMKAALDTAPCKSAWKNCAAASKSHRNPTS